MKYFLCMFGTVYLGIPSERTERVISVFRKQSSVCEIENQDVIISLPLLFGRADLSAPHGIVLKTDNEKRTPVLLAPPLDIDLEIPEENIFTVPKTFEKMLRYCNGACFINKDQKERLVLTLSIEKILGDYK